VITRLRADLVLDARDELGEGPVWNAADGVLEWVDITGSRLQRFDPRTGRHTVRDLGMHIGAFAPRASGGHIVAVAAGFGVLDGDSDEVRVVAPVIADDPDVRMNDGACDPRGRFWAGTMAYDLRAGGGMLYRLDADWSVHTVLTGVTCSNGLDWSDDGTTMYYVDSFAYSVDAFDYDDDTGAVHARRRVVEVPDDPAVPMGMVVPDGMCLDAEGCIWVAAHGSGEVRRFDGRGNLLAVVDVDAPAVTSIAFGGDDLGDLYITSGHAFAPGDPRERDSEGGLFRCRPGVRGRAATPFAG
jgi:sugar lactone lactonase YvrE